MGKIISIAIQKGGCGKTSTTLCLASSLKEMGYKVLMMDLDPQGNLTYGSGVENVEKTIYNLLREQAESNRETDIKEVIVHSSSYNVDVIPANIRLAGGEREFTNIGREYLLKQVLLSIKDDYDFILVDCPPSLGILTVNAFTASDYIIIPTEPSYFALQGLEQLNNTIETVREYCNQNLKILGVLLTRYNKRTNLAKFAVEEIEDVVKDMKTTIFNTKISESIVVKEAQSLQIPLNKHETKSTVNKQYREFAKELLEGVK